MNASKQRKTQFELMSFVQGANSFGVRVASRDGSGAVDLELPESLFTDDVMTQIHTSLEALERAAALVFAEHAAKPEVLHATINAAAQAAKELETTNAAIAAAQLAAQVHDLDQLAKRAEAEQELEAKKAEAEQLEAKLAAMRAAVEAQAAPATEETTKTE